MEEWKDLAHLGFSRYSVSTEGDVRNDESMHILRQSYNQAGLLKVGLLHDLRDRQTSIGVALLVASQFLPGRTENFNTPININGHRADNRVRNLAWRPLWFAREYHRQFLKKTYFLKRPIREVLIEDRDFANYHEAVVAYGILAKDIHMDIFNRTGVFPGGHRFELLEEED